MYEHCSFENILPRGGIRMETIVYLTAIVVGTIIYLVAKKRKQFNDMNAKDLSRFFYPKEKLTAVSLSNRIYTTTSGKRKVPVAMLIKKLNELVAKDEFRCDITVVDRYYIQSTKITIEKFEYYPSPS